MKLTRNRWLTAHGFGVHSPWAYNFIVDVIGEKNPYYAYEDLSAFRESAPSALPVLEERVDKMLFRIVNHILPLTIIEVGTGAGVSAGYMAAVSADIDLVTIDSNHHYADVVKSSLSLFGNILYKNGDVVDILNGILSKNSGKTIYHIAHTSFYAEVFDLLLQKVSTDTVVIVEGLDNSNRYKWWANIIQDDRVGETFETKTTGIILFDKKKYKQHYRI